METIIIFFRDTLSGTVYTIVSIVCSILILICLILLFKRNRKLKEKADEYEQSHIVIINKKGEEETVEIAKSSTNINASSSVVANMSATASLNNVPKSVVSTTTTVNSTIPPSSKPVVTINPLEVASVSSTMNVIGTTSAQKAALGNSVSMQEISDKVDSDAKIPILNENVIDPASIESVVGTTVIDPASIAKAVGTTVIDPASIASTVGTTKIIDPESIASAVGTTVIDPASIASTVGTTKIMNDENIDNAASSDEIVSQ